MSLPVLLCWHSQVYTENKDISTKDKASVSNCDTGSVCLVTRQSGDVGDIKLQVLGESVEDR